jgi:hypothetical protein
MGTRSIPTCAAGETCKEVGAPLLLDVTTPTAS